MILTVTANVAIDRTYVIDHLDVGAVHKVQEVLAHTGGKGVNVSRCVHALGGETLVTGIVGANNFDAATRDLNEAGLSSALYAIDGPGRQTVTVTAQDGTTTAFDEAGPELRLHDFDGFTEHYEGLLPDAQMVVIAGSLPPGAPEQALRLLCALARKHDVPVILDARGPAMRAAQPEQPLVAKLNRSELEQTLERELGSDDDAILEAATELRAQGAQHVIVTLGPDGAIALGEHRAYKISHPPASGNPIGAGDAFSAALALALSGDQPFDEAIRRGAAAALASLATPTAGALEPAAMRDALPTIEIHELTKAASR